MVVVRRRRAMFSLRGCLLVGIRCEFWTIAIHLGWLGMVRRWLVAACSYYGKMFIVPRSSPRLGSNDSELERGTRIRLANKTTRPHEPLAHGSGTIHWAAWARKRPWILRRYGRGGPRKKPPEPPDPPDPWRDLSPSFCLLACLAHDKLCECALVLANVRLY